MPEHRLENPDDTFVLYSKRSHVTGKKVAEALGCDSGRRLSYQDAKNYRRLVRWGSTHRPPLDRIVPIVLNKASSISIGLDRQSMLNKAAQTGISVPINTRISNDSTVATAMMGNNPQFEDTSNRNIIIRPRTGEAPWGRSIRLFQLERRESAFGPGSWAFKEEDQQDLQKLYDDRGRYSNLFVQYIPALYELRVHIINGQSYLFQIKTHDELEYGASALREGKPLIRSHENGWKLLPLSSSKARRLGINKNLIREKAKRVAEGFNLDFAAVDFMLYTRAESSTNFTPYFLEVNSAPGLEDYSLERVVGGLNTALESANEEEPNEPEPDERPNRRRYRGVDEMVRAMSARVRVDTNADSESWTSTTTTRNVAVPPPSDGPAVDAYGAIVGCSCRDCEDARNAADPPDVDLAPEF